MDVEAKVREALLGELQRQAADGSLKAQPDEGGYMAVQGRLDVEALTMAVVGSLAGGP